MRLVPHQREVLEPEVFQPGDQGIDLHPRQRLRLPGELEIRLLEVIQVEVRVPEGVNELPLLEDP
jgi:hypothetical protein